jgi:hypothetical protein
MSKINENESLEFRQNFSMMSGLHCLKREKKRLALFA